MVVFEKSIQKILVMRYIIDPVVLEMAHKVAKSVDNITTRSCETLQPGSLCSTTSRNDCMQRGIYRCLTCFRKQPQQNHTGELFATIHAHTDILMMYLQYGCEMLKWRACKTPFCKSGHIHM